MISRQLDDAVSNRMTQERRYIRDRESVPRFRASDEELDRRLHDAVQHLLDYECPSLAAAVNEARKRLRR
jgi:hypothetical protein